MSPRQVFAPVLHLFILFAFLATGLFFMCVPYQEGIRFQIIELLTHRYELCTWIGGGFFFVSFLLFLGFFALNRGRYLQIEMGRLGPTDVDVKLIRQTVEECFKAHFASMLSLESVEILPRSRLEIAVTLTGPLDKKFLQIVEKQLQSHLLARVGYSKPFFFKIINPSI